LWWALEQLGIVSEDGSESSPLPSSEEYVVLGLVERAADAIASRQANNARGPGDAVYSLEEFRKEFADVLGGKELCEKDVKILLRFLQRDREILVVDKKVGAVRLPCYRRRLCGS
jgi:charged multivesicular body protein 7